MKCVINESSINQPNELINFPYLEDFRLFSSSFNEYINFKNLKKLKVIYTESSDLAKIKDKDISSLTSLEEINIFNAFNNNKAMVKKLLLFPNVQQALISGRITSEDLKNVKGKNLSLKKLTMKDIQRECTLNDFQKLFPNVDKIIIDSIKTPMEVHPWCGTCQMEQRGKHYKTSIEIKENKKCKTDRIRIIGGGCSEISLSCNSFENVKELYVDIQNMVSCFTFPVFDDENTDKMPNLKTFRFSCCLTKFDEKIYLDLIKKLLLLNLDEIYLLIRIGTFTSADYFLGFTNDQNRYDYDSYERYSKQELLDMCEDKKVIIKNYRKIAIYKLNNREF